jgi:hypothetical protein
MQSFILNGFLNKDAQVRNLLQKKSIFKCYFLPHPNPYALREGLFHCLLFSYLLFTEGGLRKRSDLKAPIWSVKG